MIFNENSRVKIPAILHLTKLGYQYLSLKDIGQWDKNTNIFFDIFIRSFQKINPDIDEDEALRTFQNILLTLENEDLGQEFYKMLISSSGPKLIDFEHFDNNSFHVVTELPYKNGEDEFRPDITLLINGLPLAFIEVKKPNNQEGILAERKRINTRFQNKKFRKFINLTQFLVFSNNMEYDNESLVPLQGAFYATTSYNEANFNCFREEETSFIDSFKPENVTVENFVLQDNNLAIIKNSPEFIINKKTDTPTNRLLTSLFSKDRLKTFLKYGLAYVMGTNGLEKHIIRYQQFFATKAIEKTLNQNIKKGIIWHTQGSGKTALAYFNVNYLTDYFQKKDIIPKFYFIVDRIDLMNQAKSELSSRGLIVHTVNSKEELLTDFRSQKSIHNFAGQREITVVNIQKFAEDNNLLEQTSYALNTQRIYFLDEVHRSYDPQGSFLANLISSDRDAIMLGLTGTPLISRDRKSKEIFGDYIHKYYYNSSIADGCTLKLIREGIETNYRAKLNQILIDLEVKLGSIDKKSIFAHHQFVEPMLDYIINDFVKSRLRFGDPSIGGMVVCGSSEQAKKLFEIFQNKYVKESNIPLTAALILHDVDDKDTRKKEVADFKASKIDLLFVYNMLLTGFDAKRLKKLYLNRVIRDHNLLQTLTRVNRPYKNFRYGFVVDFADIREEFDLTNKAYFTELQEELGDELSNYSNLFKSSIEIEAEINNLKENLFQYDLENLENFSAQVTQIQEKKILLSLKKSLESAKNLYNVIRASGQFEFLEKLNFKKLGQLFNVVDSHLNLINFKESLNESSDNVNLLNVALEDIYFMFKKVSEEELVIADKLRDNLKEVRREFSQNIDPQDQNYVSLYEELRRLFKKENLDEVSQEEMKVNLVQLEKIREKIVELNRKNNLLQTKYNNDSKFARIHKRLLERRVLSDLESKIFTLLSATKKETDETILLNTKLLDNESYFVSLMRKNLIQQFEKNNLKLDVETVNFINTQITKEYLQELKEEEPK